MKMNIKKILYVIAYGMNGKGTKYEIKIFSKQHFKLRRKSVEKVSVSTQKEERNYQLKMLKHFTAIAYCFICFSRIICWLYLNLIYPNINKFHYI